jgi:hypothetical protein
MKPRLLNVTLALALLGFVVGFLDVVSSFYAGHGIIGHSARLWARIFAVLEFIPAAGVWFTVSDRVWTPVKRSLWMVWVLAALPILFLGALLALVCFSGTP